MVTCSLVRDFRSLLLFLYNRLLGRTLLGRLRVFGGGSGLNGRGGLVTRLSGVLNSTSGLVLSLPAFFQLFRHF